MERATAPDWGVQDFGSRAWLALQVHGSQGISRWPERDAPTDRTGPMESGGRCGVPWWTESGRIERQAAGPDGLPRQGGVAGQVGRQLPKSMDLQSQEPWRRPGQALVPTYKTRCPGLQDAMGRATRLGERGHKTLEAGLQGSPGWAPTLARAGSKTREAGPQSLRGGATRFARPVCGTSGPGLQEERARAAKRAGQVCETRGAGLQDELGRSARLADRVSKTRCPGLQDPRSRAGRPRGGPRRTARPGIGGPRRWQTLSRMPMLGVSSVTTHRRRRATSASTSTIHLDHPQDTHRQGGDRLRRERRTH